MTEGSGVTNNAIEFLVTLGINSKQSTTNINNFLKTINDKNLKLIYNVNQTQSNNNIIEFLKKHEDKTLKLKFDVNKGISTENLKSFVNGFKTTSPKVTFDADRINSRANFNKFLENVKLKPVRVDFAFANSVTKSKINRAIGDINTEISTVLTLDFDKSQKNVLEGIKRIEIPDLKIEMGLDNTKVNPEMFKEYEKTIKDLQKHIDSLEAKIKNFSTSSQTTTSPKGSDSTGIFGELIGKKNEVVKQIKDYAKEIEREIHIFTGSVEKGQKDFFKTLENEGYRIKKDIDPVSDEVVRVTATIKNSANEIETKVFKRFSEGYKNSKDSAEGAMKAVHGFILESKKIDDKKFYEVNEELTKTEQRLENLRHKGLIAVNEYNRLSNELANVGGNKDRLHEISKEMDRISNQTKNTLELEMARAQALKRQQIMLSNLEKTERLYRKTVDRVQVQLTKDRIQEQTRNIRSATDLGQLKQVNMAFDSIYENVRRINAQATEATKNSMTMVDAFKIAMERFPIWMMASTIFYGVIRSAREFTRIIIDIDTKMTDLKKVMSEDTDFAKVFDEATQSAQRFGQTLSDTMDAYIEFARQGFKGDELQDLANATLVASNVAEVEAGKMAEYMTASMIQWDMQSNQAMSVIDKWNEISNNYATTVDKLAEGQAKAGATAKAMGLDFDQLNAVIGTVTSSTKQSGEEVGWDFSPSPFIW